MLTRSRPRLDIVPRGIQQSSASLILIALAIPTLLLSIAAAGTGVLSGDVAATLFIQQHTPVLFAGLFEVINALGTTLGATLVTLALGILIALRRQPFIAALVLLTLPIRALNALIKVILESPRPPNALVTITEYAHGFGFPSGHVMGATVLYGALFLLAPRFTTNRLSRLTIQSAAIVMIVLAGVSRIYVGAHWPSDVIGAYMWGSIVLLCAVLLVRRSPLNCLRLR